MSTDAQVRANRTNAQRSTGPRTAAGKAASRLNALKHGVLAKHVVLPNEDAEEFDALKAGVYQQLQPLGELQGLCAELITVYAWRLRRVMRVEAGIFLREVYGQVAENARRDVGRHVSHPGSLLTELAASLAQNEGEEVIDDPEAHQAALKRAEEAEAIRNSDEGLLGDAFMRDAARADTLSKLSRYEAHIQRCMFKTLDELRRLQAGRNEIDAGPLGANSK